MIVTDPHAAILLLILDELKQIRGGLGEMQAIFQVGTAAEDDADETGCAHPEAQRVSLATPHQPDHWVCAACRYEHAGLTRN